MDVPHSNVRPTSTPQNTPANAAPISSRAQQPGVGTIKEGMSHHRNLLPLQPPPCLVVKGLTANLTFFLQRNSSALPPVFSLPTPPSLP